MQIWISVTIFANLKKSEKSYFFLPQNTIVRTAQLTIQSMYEI